MLPYFCWFCSSLWCSPCWAAPAPACQTGTGLPPCMPAHFMRYLDKTIRILQPLLQGMNLFEIINLSKAFQVWLSTEPSRDRLPSPILPPIWVLHGDSVPAGDTERPERGQGNPRHSSGEDWQLCLLLPLVLRPGQCSVSGSCSVLSTQDTARAWPHPGAEVGWGYRFYSEVAKSSTDSWF